MSFKCPFCPRRLATNQGITSHISQTQTCRDKLNTFYDNLNAQLDQAGPSSTRRDEDAQQEGADVNIDVEMGHNGSSSPPDFSCDIPDDSAPAPSLQQERHRRATVEDAPDEDDAPKLPEGEVWIDDYDEDRQAGATGQPCKTSFEFHRDQQREARLEPWSPFESEDEWELARWLMSAGVSQKKMDTLLKLKLVIRNLYCFCKLFGCSPNETHHRFRKQDLSKRDRHSITAGLFFNELMPYLEDPNGSAQRSVSLEMNSTRMEKDEPRILSFGIEILLNASRSLSQTQPFAINWLTHH